jgi:hypothetical protein
MTVSIESSLELVVCVFGESFLRTPCFSPFPVEQKFYLNLRLDLHFSNVQGNGKSAIAVGLFLNPFDLLGQ